MGGSSTCCPQEEPCGLDVNDSPDYVFLIQCIQIKFNLWYIEVQNIQAQESNFSREKHAVQPAK